MNATLSRALSFGAAFCLSAGFAAGQPASRTGGMSVLIIGDSNTEFGRIAAGLTDTLQRYFGVPGTGYGYIPMFSTFLALRDKVYTGVSVSYGSGWTLQDMYEVTRINPPFLSPNGHWLKSTTVDASASVGFSGNGIDIYWLAQARGGTFTVTVDNVVKAEVNTGAPAYGVRKTSITGLSAGSHTCVAKAGEVPSQGAITLLGFEARTDVAGREKRPVVHNWGNGWASTQDFLGIDSTIFATGLRQLAPDVIVVLLGTNDHGNDSRSAADFKANLKRILARIKAAQVTPNVLLASTIKTNTGSNLLPQYLATSWPEAAAESGVAYWDMGTWFGPWSSAQMADANHVNQAGGRKIGVEMLKQILARFPSLTTRVALPPRLQPGARRPGLRHRGSLVKANGAVLPAVAEGR